MSAQETTFSVAEISAELTRLAALDSRTLAASIDQTKFGEVLELVVKSIVAGVNDVEIAVLGALARVRVTHRELFIQKKPRHGFTKWHLRDETFANAMKRKKHA